MFEQIVVYFWTRLCFADDKGLAAQLIPGNRVAFCQFVTLWKHDENPFAPQMLCVTIQKGWMSRNKRYVDMVPADSRHVHSRDAVYQVQSYPRFDLMMRVEKIGKKT